MEEKSLLISWESFIPIYISISTIFFSGNIPHSARPPSFNFSGARLTFVTKLHKNEYTGRKKNFQEDHRHIASSAGMIEMMDILASKKGERYAKMQLDQLRKMKTKITYRKCIFG